MRSQAWSEYARSFALNRELGNIKQCDMVVFNLGEVALKLAEPDLAVTLLLASERLLEEARFPNRPCRGRNGNALPMGLRQDVALRPVAVVSLAGGVTQCTADLAAHRVYFR